MGYNNKMKLSISNLAWNESEDKIIYSFLKENGFSGIEIAPKKNFPMFPDVAHAELELFRSLIYEEYGLEVASIQSILYGCTENIFSSAQERAYLMNYIKKVILITEKLGCRNIVFGCPRNRSYEGQLDVDIAHDFFFSLGSFAVKHNVIISIEANPVIYNTNFLNTTLDTFNFVKKTNCDGIKVNLDIGTILQNNENIEHYITDIMLINHVHISEPNLELIQERKLHDELYTMLAKNDYDRYISIEMKTQEDIEKIKDVIMYVKSIGGY